MKRLTGRRDGRTYIVGCPNFALPKIVGLIIQQTVDRLAAIEDILGDEYDLDRLHELMEADRDGRCVVLPKDGMVYYIEEAGGEKWIGNKPIQQVILRCGFGMALLEFSLFDKGKYFSRTEAEDALRREQDG